jgi:hypothetical protein
VAVFGGVEDTEVVTVTVDEAAEFFTTATDIATKV